MYILIKASTIKRLTASAAETAITVVFVVSCSLDLSEESLDPSEETLDPSEESLDLSEEEMVM